MIWIGLIIGIPAVLLIAFWAWDAITEPKDFALIVEYLRRQRQPQPGRTIARNTGVGQARIYVRLARLVDDGVVNWQYITPMDGEPRRREFWLAK